MFVVDYLLLFCFIVRFFIIDALFRRLVLLWVLLFLQHNQLIKIPSYCQWLLTRILLLKCQKYLIHSQLLCMLDVGHCWLVLVVAVEWFKYLLFRYLIPLQLFTYWLAIESGTNPDVFRRDDPTHAAASKKYTLTTSY